MTTAKSEVTLLERFKNNIESHPHTFRRSLVNALPIAMSGSVLSTLLRIGFSVIAYKQKEEHRALKIQAHPEEAKKIKTEQQIVSVAHEAAACMAVAGAFMQNEELLTAGQIASGLMFHFHLFSNLSNHKRHDEMKKYRATIFKRGEKPVF